MTTDLEDKLRAALHERGAAITADRLRPADSGRQDTSLEPVWAVGTLAKPEGRHTSTGARIVPVLAAAAVVGVIVALAFAVSGESRRDQPAGGGSSALSGIRGHTWVLETVQAPDGTTTTISAATGASVTFLGTGNRVEFQDGLAVFQAEFTFLGDGRLRVHGVSGDHSYYRGHDRSQLAAIAGVDAIGVPSGTSAPPPVQVELASGRLNISTQGYRLTFSNPVPVAPPASKLPLTPPAHTTATAAHASPTVS